jgi:hypothetical protein
MTVRKQVPLVSHLPAYNVQTCFSLNITLKCEVYIFYTYCVMEILNGELWKSQRHQVVFALGCQITEPN